MTHRKTFENIHKHLDTLPKPQRSLFSYLKIDRAASDEMILQALDRRRRWAQGFQSNPKYRAEATWIIRNHRTLRRLMVHHRDDYLQFLEEREQGLSRALLEMFIRGAMLNGTITAATEVAIIAQSRRLGLRDSVARALFERLLASSNIVRPEAVPDYYVTLGAQLGTPQAHLRMLFERRLRQARAIEDPDRYCATINDIHEAWRTLGEPLRRRLYDIHYRNAHPDLVEDVDDEMTMDVPKPAQVNVMTASAS
ncbi:MAG: hypothetical protein AAFV53_26320 [Myxococcota bacterium]